MNAFDILGATPDDTNEQLQELLDEKLLLTDDEDAVQEAYFELSNPKRRIKQEILYFSDSDLADFNRIVLKQYDEAPTVNIVTVTIVKAGLWFENCQADLSEKIKDARIISGFTQITETGLIYNEIETLKKASLSAATSYLDSLKEQTVVKIFNAIVKQNNYQSYFIDELMAYYELHISDTLKIKEDKCKAIMAEIEIDGKDCINKLWMWPAADNIVLTFKSALKDWDEYAQPLQVNMQRRGGEHGASSNLVYDLRNTIINMCNDMQSWICSDLEKLTRLTKDASNGYGSNYHRYDLIVEMKSTQDSLVKKIPVGIKIIDISVKLIDILLSVFAELEIVVEKLKKDKDYMLELKDTLNKIRTDIKDIETQETQETQGTQGTQEAQEIVVEKQKKDKDDMFELKDTLNKIRTDINTYNEYKKEKLKNPVMDKSYHVFTVEQEDKKRKRNKMIFGIYNGVIAFILMIIFIVTIAIGTAEGFWIVFTIGIFIAYIIGLLINFYASRFETSSKIGFSILMTFFTLLMSIGLFTG